MRGVYIQLKKEQKRVEKSGETNKAIGGETQGHATMALPRNDGRDGEAWVGV